MNLRFREAFIVVTLCLVALSAHCQGPEIRYFDKLHERCEKKDCHYYYKLDQRDTTRTFYCSNGMARSVEPLDATGLVHGTCVYFFDNGQMCARVPYEKQKVVGVKETWYRDGRKRSEFKSETDEILNYWDATGRAEVVNGNGFCRYVSDDFNEVGGTEVGKVVNGKRDSVWVGYRDNNVKWFEESYEAGKLIQGVSTDDAGVTYNYNEVWEQAKHPKGIEGFYQYVGQNVRYPKPARRQNIEGRVFVQFVVQKDGTITDIQCIKGIGGGCDEEAVRVIAESAQWKAGRQRGKPVRQRMVLPIMFKLG